MKCPCCKNVVEGKFVPSGMRKFLTGATKKGGMKLALGGVGAAFGGIGAIPGIAIGAAVDSLFGDDINELVDSAADIFQDSETYHFVCPNCGHDWTENYLYDTPVNKHSEIDDDDEYDDNEEYSDDNEYNDEYDEDDNEWFSDTVDEIESCIEEANDSDILSEEFYDNIDCSITLILETLNRIKEQAEEDEEAMKEQLIDLYRECINAIGKKCNGGMDNRIAVDESDYRKDFSMEISASYPYVDGTMILVGLVKTGRVKIDDVILCGGKEYKVGGVIMFEKILVECEAGDVAGLIVPANKDCRIERGTVATCNNAEKTKDLDNATEISDSEKEYLDAVKSCLEDDGTITDKERKLLNRLCQSLNISEERAKSLEKSLSESKLLPNEQEYADEVKATIGEDGKLSEKECRLLARVGKSLGLTDERMSEINHMLGA